MTQADARAELAAIGRALDSLGLVVASGGNLSVRLDDGVLIKASGRAFRDAAEDDYVLVDAADGTLLAPGPAPSCETPVHLACYQADATVRAVLHCHPPRAIAWAATGRPLPSITPDMRALLGPEVPLVPFDHPGSDRLARHVGEKIGLGARAVFMSNHGIVTVGETLQRAHDRLSLVETALQAQLHARLLGTEVPPVPAPEPGRGTPYG